MPRAGLDPVAVTGAGAALADEIGFPRLSMGTLAERLGVRTPSLYKHVDGLADLAHRIAVLALTELGDSVTARTQGRAGRDALAAAAGAMRTYVRAHPGRYAATIGVRPTGPDDPLVGAGDRLLDAFAAVLSGYGLSSTQGIHATRLVRSVLHGFVTLEVADGFQMGVDVDDTFAWMIDVLDRGLVAEQPRG